MSGFLTQLSPEVRRQVIDLLAQVGVERDRIDEILSGSSTVDHGTLIGLGDDDHPQYAKLTALQDEATLRANADTALGQADTALDIRVDVEETARIAADAALHVRDDDQDVLIAANAAGLVDEIADRIAADALLRADVDTNIDDIATNASAIAQEIVDRVAADAAHVAHPDPHPVYLTEDEADVLYVNVDGDVMTGGLEVDGDFQANQTVDIYSNNVLATPNERLFTWKTTNAGSLALIPYTDNKAGAWGFPFSVKANDAGFPTVSMHGASVVTVPTPTVVNSATTMSYVDAADDVLQANIDAITDSIDQHIDNAVDAHAGTAITFTAAGDISSTNVEAAIFEVAADAAFERGQLATTLTAGINLNAGDIVDLDAAVAANEGAIVTINGDLVQLTADMTAGLAGKIDNGGAAADIAANPSLVPGGKIDIALGDLDTVLGGLNTDLNVAEAAIVVAQADIVTAEANIVTAQGDIAANDGAIAANAAAVASAQADLDTAEAALAQAVIDLDAAELAVAANAAAIVVNDADIAANAAAVASAQADLDVAEATLASTVIDLNTAEGTLATAVADLDTAEAAIVVAQGDIGTLSSSLVTAQNDIAQAELDIVANDAAVVSAQADLDAAELTLAAAVSDISAAEADILTKIPNGGAAADVNANVTTISGGKITAGSVTAAQVAAGTITANEIATDTITAGKIAAGAITTSELATNAVTAAKITAGTITGNKLVAGTITATQIATDTITAANIAAGAITASEIATDAVTANEIAANAVTASEIAASAVTTAKLDAGAVTAAKITAGTITALEIAGGTITGAKIAAGTIAASNIVTGAITALQIAAGTITSAEIATNSITAGNIAAGAITTSELATNAVTAVKITAGTITGDKLVANTITATQIASNTITASQIAADAITTSELAAGAVTAGKIFAGAIVAADIAAGTITGTNIAAGTITGTNLVAATITATQIATDAITANKIAAGAVSTSELAANAVTANEIVAGAIGTDELAANAVVASKILAGTITGDRLETATITSNEIASNTIVAQNIAGLTITAAEISSQAITAAKIAALAIDATHISADAIDASHISANAIESGMIQAGTIQGDRIDAHAVIVVGSDSNTIVVQGTALDTTTLIRSGTTSWQGYDGDAEFAALDWSTTDVVVPLQGEADTHIGNGTWPAGTFAGATYQPIDIPNIPNAVGVSGYEDTITGSFDAAGTTNQWSILTVDVPIIPDGEMMGLWSNGGTSQGLGMYVMNTGGLYEAVCWHLAGSTSRDSARMTLPSGPGVHCVGMRTGATTGEEMAVYVDGEWSPATTLAWNLTDGTGGPDLGRTYPGMSKPDMGVDHTLADLGGSIAYFVWDRYTTVPTTLHDDYYRALFRGGFYLDASGRFSLGSQFSYDGEGQLAIGGYASSTELAAQEQLTIAAQFDADLALANAALSQADATTALSNAATSQSAADAAQTAADAAQAAADAADAVGVAAQGSADAAQTTADSKATTASVTAAQNAANAAQSAANNAQADADAAQVTADSKATTASVAAAEAAAISAAATDAQTKADAAQAAATAVANSKADPATVTAAQNAADAAQADADSAAADAATAQTAANNAATAASTAQTAADDAAADAAAAAADALAAQNTANTAITNAAAAQATGDAAVADAASAQASADLAILNANDARTTGWRMAALSPHICTHNMTVNVAAVEDGLTVLKNGVVVVDDQPAGWTGSFSATAGDVLEFTAVCGFVTNSSESPIPIAYADTQFAWYTSRYQPDVVRLVATTSDAEVEIRAGDPNKVTPDWTVSATHNAATTVTLTGQGTDEVYLTASSPVVASKAGTGGDETILYPVGTEMIGDTAAKVPFGTGVTTVATSGGYGYATSDDNMPFQMMGIGDGSGGNCEQATPVAALTDTYFIPHAIGGFAVAAVHSTFITAHYWDSVAGDWVLYGTYDHGAASRSNYQGTNIGTQSGSGSLGTNATIWRFVGTDRFWLRTNTTTGDEYVCIGYDSSLRYLATMSGDGKVFTVDEGARVEIIADAAQAAADAAQATGDSAVSAAATAQAAAVAADAVGAAAQVAADAAQVAADAAQATGDAAWTTGDEIAVVAAINLLPGTTTIDGGKIATNSLTADQIAANAITTSELASNSVTSANIVGQTIVAGDIASGTITAAQIASQTITAGNIVANTITAGQIATDAITTSELAANSVTSGHIVAQTIVAGDIATGTITAAQIASNTITAGEILANTITASEILAGTITTTELNANAIQSTSPAYSYTSGPYSTAGSKFDLVTGDIVTENFSVIGGDTNVKGEITATDLTLLLDDGTTTGLHLDPQSTADDYDASVKFMHGTSGSDTDIHTRISWNTNYSTYGYPQFLIEAPAGYTSTSTFPRNQMFLQRGATSATSGYTAIGGHATPAYGQMRAVGTANTLGEVDLIAWSSTGTTKIELNSGSLGDIQFTAGNSLVAQVSSGLWDFQSKNTQGFGWVKGTGFEIHAVGIKYNGVTIAGGTANAIGFRWSSPYILGTIDNVSWCVVGTVSDRRIKRGIRNYNDGLRDIKQLTPRAFKSREFSRSEPEIGPPGPLEFRDSSGDREIVGLVADEVRQVLPDYVVGEASDHQLEGVNYLALITPLVQAVQELSARLEVLEARGAK